MYRQLRARRALSLFNDDLFSTRRALLLYKVYGDSTLLVLNGTLLTPFWLSADDVFIVLALCKEMLILIQMLCVILSIALHKYKLLVLKYKYI